VWERHSHYQKAGGMHGNSVPSVIIGNNAQKLFSSIEFFFLSVVFTLICILLCAKTAFSLVAFHVVPVHPSGTSRVRFEPERTGTPFLFFF